MTTSLLALIGPAGSGKSTLARALADRGLVVQVPAGLLSQYGIDGISGVALVVTSADQVATVAAATGLTPIVYQVCAPIDQVAARLPETAGSVERLIGFHAERVAGARISDRGFVNNGSLTELVAAVSLALATDFETGGNHVGITTAVA
jgi:energy-coupling factor transporter ATP-binding protein EcfA2